MDLQRNTVKSELFSGKKANSPKNERFRQVIIGLVTFIIIYGFVAFSITPQRYNLSPGDIATVDIISPKDVIDDITTNMLIEQAKNNAGEVYLPDKSVQVQAVSGVNTFFEKVLEIKNQDIKSAQNTQSTQNTQNAGTTDKAKADKLKTESQFILPDVLADDDYITAVKANDGDLNALKDKIIENLNIIFGQNIKNDENDLKAKKQDFSYSMANLKLNKELRDLGTSIGFVLIKPNMVYDSKATIEKQDEAKDKVKPAVIRKYQKIVTKGEEVTDAQIAVLKKLGLLEKQWEIDIPSLIGLGILIALLEGLVIIYLYKFSPEIIKSLSKLMLISIIVVIELLFAIFISAYNISGFLIPTAFAAMLVAILLKPGVALVLNVALSAFVTLIAGYNIDIFIVALIGGSAGAIAVSRMHQRNDLIRAGLIVSLVNAFSILGTSLINSSLTETVLIMSLLGIINGALSSIFTTGLLPFCETTFDIVTPMKLLELSNPNQPLLKRLLFEAPGTYHHSILVGNLAEAAVDAIGGNSLLARVGSYYHDVGKVKRPYFFKENQLTNENPHDKITPSLSTLIITSHVKDGSEMAKKYKLPSSIINMIKQHHGTTLIKYFYVKAVNDSSIHDDVKEEQFRYEGPKPDTRESAIIMLADSVEAAVRSIPSPTKASIEEMVRKIIKDKVDDNQLDNCDITLKDLNKITSAFFNVLNGIYHDRIEYPQLDTNEKEGISNDSNDRQ